jgi:hypothetical protein
MFRPRVTLLSKIEHTIQSLLTCLKINSQRPRDLSDKQPRGKDSARVLGCAPAGCRLEHSAAT